ncbi:MAG TPA: hypothetical protein VD788_09105 [Candidatus Polarisedimenticolaceae bacterium]|nr:hypothetical protein [Candidatus Polarisedimenticolaceae bacterium]
MAHFEKMLYDNARLVPAYLDGYQASGEPGFATIARELCDYLLREMAAPGGGATASPPAGTSRVAACCGS